MIWFLLLREVILVTAQQTTTTSSSTSNTVSTTSAATTQGTTINSTGQSSSTTSKYWGQEISEHLFEDDTRFGIKYNPNVIPIGSEDYKNIEKKDFLSAKDFIEKKCVQYDEFLSSKLRFVCFLSSFLKHTGATTMKIMTKLTTSTKKDHMITIMIAVKELVPAISTT